MNGTRVSVRLWREGMYTCYLSTVGYPHLRVSAKKKVIATESVTTWYQACERAIVLQEVAKRALAQLES